MELTATVVERTHQEAGWTSSVVFPRKAIDPDTALVAQLPERMRGGGASWLRTGIASTAWPFASRQRLGRGGSRAGRPVDASRKIDTFRGRRLRLLGVPDHRQRGLPEAAGAAEPATRSVVEDLAPAFDEQGQHAEAAGDWSRRLKDPASKASSSRARRASMSCRRTTARPFSCTMWKGSRTPRSPRRCRSGWARSSRACTGAALPAEAPGGLHGRRPRGRSMAGAVHFSWAAMVIVLMTSRRICISQSCGKKLLVHPAGRRHNPNEETEGATAAARSRAGCRLPEVAAGRERAPMMVDHAEWFLFAWVFGNQAGFLCPCPRPARCGRAGRKRLPEHGGDHCIAVGASLART